MAFKKEEEKEMKGNKMKKLLSLLAILAVAMPSMAGITINVDVDDNDPTVAVITYTATAGDEPCALALDITPVNTGDALSSYTLGDTFFDVFIDQASDDVALNGTYTVGTGSPIAKIAEAGVAAIDAGAVCISLAGLEDDAADVAPATATIITVTGTGTFTISENAIRGGVVKADASAPSVDVTFTVEGSAGTEFTLGASDPIADTIWDNDHCPAHGLGDANCDGAVNFTDLAALKTSFFKTFGVAGYNCGADFNEDGAVNFTDLAILKTNFFQSGLGGDGTAACPTELP